VSKTPMTDEVERFHSYGRLHNHAMELERALNECEAALQMDYYDVLSGKRRGEALAAVTALKEKYE